MGPGVYLGDNVKLQNYALVYEPARLADGVFVGPAAVLTNDTYPRAVTPEGRLKGNVDWTAVMVNIREGAAIGARAVCVAPVTIGRWALVAARAASFHCGELALPSSSSFSALSTACRLPCFASAKRT